MITSLHIFSVTKTSEPTAHDLHNCLTVCTTSLPKEVGVSCDLNFPSHVLNYYGLHNFHKEVVVPSQQIYQSQVTSN